MLRKGRHAHGLAVVAALGAFSFASAVRAITLVVTGTDDNVDGDTSSPAALIANPGPDATISLREALLAANNVPGPNTITFAPALAGKGSPLPNASPRLSRTG
jgi:hypothetical protein